MILKFFKCSSTMVTLRWATLIVFVTAIASSRRHFIILSLGYSSGARIWDMRFTLESTRGTRRCDTRALHRTREHLCSQSPTLGMPPVCRRGSMASWPASTSEAYWRRCLVLAALTRDMPPVCRRASTAVWPARTSEAFWQRCLGSVGWWDNSFGTGVRTGVRGAGCTHGGFHVGPCNHSE